jgi:hypothetical protein
MKRKTLRNIFKIFATLMVLATVLFLLAPIL